MRSLDCEDAQNLTSPDQKSPEKPSVENLLLDFDFDHTVGKRLMSIKGARSVVLMVVDALDSDGSFPRKVANLVSKTIDEYSRPWKEWKSVPRIVLVVTKYWAIKILVDDVVDLAGARGQASVPGTTLCILRVEGVVPGNAKLFWTPGLLHPHQILTRLIIEEQKLVYIKNELKPRTYRIYVGHLVHVGGLLRLDVEELSADSLYVTVWASPLSPLHMGKTENASAILRNTLVTRYRHLSVPEPYQCVNACQPPIGQERVEKPVKWVRKEFRVTAGLGWFAIGIRVEAVLGVRSYDGVDIVSRNALLPGRSHSYEVAGFTVPKIITRADRANKQHKKEERRQVTVSNELDQQSDSAVVAPDAPQTLTVDSVCNT
ncbi:OLC1v1006042C1 [Oldenlandia corymbosa var. corymbosa]|uniref:OLC1v1006042C1 n=1 Tax=Oldenlandia corymbosa var. corymbosa TaxID=529605 RepID=A0AAV1DG13_OLDCO|nr:OLC1v1006042C1 [Oldenlandia corymbosa var. corymbosa]